MLPDLLHVLCGADCQLLNRLFQMFAACGNHSHAYSPTMIIDSCSHPVEPANCMLKQKHSRSHSQDLSLLFESCQKCRKVLKSLIEHPDQPHSPCPSYPVGTVVGLPEDPLLLLIAAAASAAALSSSSSLAASPTHNCRNEAHVLA